MALGKSRLALAMHGILGRGKNLRTNEHTALLWHTGRRKGLGPPAMEIVDSNLGRHVWVSRRFPRNMKPYVLSMSIYFFETGEGCNAKYMRGPRSPGEWRCTFPRGPRLKFHPSRGDFTMRRAHREFVMWKSILNSGAWAKWSSRALIKMKATLESYS
ncbi:hypothetical protein KM043_006993 [Ampulex compressa]|nr:hypothetical protein KM043_006993 [Ampulex compressa]